MQLRQIMALIKNKNDLPFKETYFKQLQLKKVDFCFNLKAQNKWHIFETIKHLNVLYSL